MKPASWCFAAGLLVAAPSGFAQTLYTYAIQAQPTAIFFSEDDLVRTVTRAFDDDDVLKGATLIVKVVDGRVQLEGVALTEEQRQQALAVAQYAVGPERVAEPRVELAR